MLNLFKKQVTLFILLIIVGFLTVEQNSIFGITTSTVEIVGAVTGLACVWAYGRQRIWTATISGVINIVAWAYMFASANLWADATLQVLFFLPLTLWGLYVWLKRKNSEDTRKVVDLNYMNFIVKLVVAFLLGSAVWIAVLYELDYMGIIESSVPFIDAPLAVAQIIAQYMLSRKIIQNWNVWSAVNVIMIGLMIFKGFYVTSGLYLIFLINSLASGKEWKSQETIGYLAHKLSRK